MPHLGQRWFEEVWNKGRRDAIGELMAEDAQLHDASETSIGPKGFCVFFDRMHDTFPDIHVTVHETIAQGDIECVRWSCKMKHTGHGLGFPPTGKSVEITGISIVRVAGGKMIEGWQNWDMLGLMQQIQGSAKAATYV